MYIPVLYNSCYYGCCTHQIVYPYIQASWSFLAALGALNFVCKIEWHCINAIYAVCYVHVVVCYLYTCSMLHTAVCYIRAAVCYICVWHCVI